MSIVAAKNQKVQPPDISSVELGERLSAIRNDVPRFSDHDDMQAAAAMVWRTAIDAAGSAVIRLQRGEVMP